MDVKKGKAGVNVLLNNHGQKSDFSHRHDVQVIFRPSNKMK